MSDTKESTSKEADWTKGIKSETICQYFYVLFFILAIVFGLLILWYVTIPKIGWKLALGLLPSALIAILNSLFFYLVCARSLLK